MEIEEVQFASREFRGENNKSIRVAKLKKIEQREKTMKEFV